MIIPDYEVLYKLHFFMEGFQSYKILAEKMNKFLIYLKNLLSDNNMINLFEIANLIKKAKLSIKKQEHLNDFASIKRKLYYDDQEFNQENDINQEEVHALVNELRVFCIRKFEFDKLKNELLIEIKLDPLFEKFFFVIKNHMQSNEINEQMNFKK